MSDWAERRERVLDVLERDTWHSREDVRRRAKMDTAATGWVLGWLVDEGVVERTHVRLARRGTARALYRLAVRRREAA